jgi:hypothetical protein
MGWHWSDVFIFGIFWGFMMWFMTLINLETHRQEWDWIPIVGIILFIGCIIGKIKFREPKKVVIDAKLVGIDHSSITTKDHEVFDGTITEIDIENNFHRYTWQQAEDLVGKLFEKKNYTVTIGVPTVNGGIKRQGDFGMMLRPKMVQNI